jgi:hypothetical protein
MEAITPIDPWDGPLDYERLKALASRERPAYTLIAMAAKNDPFYILPGRRKKAEWFTALWREHCQNRFDSQGRPSKMHIRGIHYVLISLAERPRMEGDGTPYENTDRCFTEMDEASRDARLLGLVPIDRIVDQRNAAPVEFLPNWSGSDHPNTSVSITEPLSAEIEAVPLETIDGPVPALIIGEVPLRPLKVLGLSNTPDLIGMPMSIEAPDLPETETDIGEGDDLVPEVTIHPPEVTPPWFHIELWCEKTTMNDILLTIAREHRLNVITGPGFQSLTGSWRLIERAKRSRRPVRILYISDFDHAGQNMPVSVARVIEFLLQREGLDLDIKLLHVALTHAQCVEYRLPRTPIRTAWRANAHSRNGTGRERPNWTPSKLSILGSSGGSCCKSLINIAIRPSRIGGRKQRGACRTNSTTFVRRSLRRTGRNWRASPPPRGRLLSGAMWRWSPSSQNGLPYSMAGSQIFPSKWWSPSMSGSSLSRTKPASSMKRSNGSTHPASPL